MLWGSWIAVALAAMVPCYVPRGEHDLLVGTWTRNGTSERFLYSGRSVCLTLIFCGTDTEREVVVVVADREAQSNATGLRSRMKGKCKNGKEGKDRRGGELGGFGLGWLMANIVVIIFKGCTYTYLSWATANGWVPPVRNEKSGIYDENLSTAVQCT